MRIKLSSKFIVRIVVLCAIATICGLLIHLKISQDDSIVYQEMIGCINAICINNGSRSKHCFETSDKIAKLIITEDANSTKQIHLDFSVKSCSK